MIQAEYRRELNHSYMIVKNAVPQLTRQYAYRMIQENRIRRLLTCQERMVDGESCLYFEISSRQALKQFYEGQRMDAAGIGQILQAVVQVQEDMGEYLLDGAGLLLEPTYIFIDVETEELYFCFYPGWGKDQNPYMHLADFFLEHVDHGQESAVNLAYQFYKMSKSDSFVLASFMPYVEKECGEMRKKSRSEEEQRWISQPDAGQDCGFFDDTNDIWQENTAYRNEARENTVYRNNVRENAPYRNEVQEDSGYSDVGRKDRRKTDVSEKKRWYQRLFGGRKNAHSTEGKRWRKADKRKEDQEGNGEEMRSLWDVYADTLENREAGETIYFSDLEKPAPKPVGRPFLVEVGGGRRFCLESLPVTVGKLEQKAEILLEDASVSRIHARFFSETDDLWLMDLNSRNGTMINDKKLAPNEAVRVECGDEIRFGRERFQFTFIDSQKE